MQNTRSLGKTIQRPERWWWWEEPEGGEVAGQKKNTRVLQTGNIWAQLLRVMAVN